MRGSELRRRVVRLLAVAALIAGAVIGAAAAAGAGTAGADDFEWNLPVLSNTVSR